mmetsp:Transcript_52868/g.115366  ORF Transcript_52868/g.115366 Transcript_52868/m.115366 type:complete len:249 (-) Transcript_52868:1082-1828(-)
MPSMSSPSGKHEQRASRKGQSSSSTCLAYTRYWVEPVGWPSVREHRTKANSPAGNSKSQSPSRATPSVPQKSPFTTVSQKALHSFKALMFDGCSTCRKSFPFWASSAMARCSKPALRSTIGQPSHVGAAITNGAFKRSRPFLATCCKCWTGSVTSDELQESKSKRGTAAVKTGVLPSCHGSWSEIDLNPSDCASICASSTSSHAPHESLSSCALCSGTPRAWPGNASGNVSGSLLSKHSDCCIMRAPK